MMTDKGSLRLSRTTLKLSQDFKLKPRSSLLIDYPAFGSLTNYSSEIPKFPFILHTEQYLLALNFIVSPAPQI